MQQIRRILHFVKPYWRTAVLSLVLLTTVVFMDLAIPRLVQRIIDQGINQRNTAVVVQTSLLMLLISLVDTLAAIGNNIFSIRTGEGAARDLREAIFLKIQSFSYGNLDHFTTGNLMVRLSSDAAAVQRFIQITLRIGTRAPLMIIGSIILMFNTDTSLALSILPLLFITSAIIVWFSLKMEPLYISVQQKLDRLNTVLQENIAGARLVKSFVRADHESRRFETSNEDFTSRTVRVMQMTSTLSPILTVLINLGVVIVIWAGGLQSIRGDLTVGQIVAFTNYLMTTMSPLIMMTNLSNTWANGFASAKRIGVVLDTRPEVPVEPDAVPLTQPVRGQVVFDHVYFHYNGNEDRAVLEDINLVAEPGQTVAILGATGAGKTSLVNLIPRFYDPSSGRVLLDGLDVRRIENSSLLAQIGIVPQESVLFTGTIRDNIRYGNPNASDDEVVAAAKAAQAHDFITAFPQGYDTRVEERGMNLSGGQKQRIAIARALLLHPRILILDDSTSSVDVETETRIQDALDQMLRGCTRFIVAQRISTVLKADKIVVIDRGCIAAEGTHAELLQGSQIYQEIYDSQLGAGLPVK